MSKNVLLVAAAAFTFALLGVVLYRFQGPGEPVMNPLGVISFGALGACLGCLASGNSDRDWGW